MVNKVILTTKKTNKMEQKDISTELDKAYKEACENGHVKDLDTAVAFKIAWDAAIKLLDLPNVNNPLPDNYWFSDENGDIAIVIGQTNEWCIMQNEGEEEQYVLPKEFVVNIHNEGNGC